MGFVNMINSNNLVRNAVGLLYVNHHGALLIKTINVMGIVFIVILTCFLISPLQQIIKQKREPLLN